MRPQSQLLPGKKWSLSWETWGKAALKCKLESFAEAASECAGSLPVGGVMGLSTLGRAGDPGECVGTKTSPWYSKERGRGKGRG